MPQDNTQKDTDAQIYELLVDTSKNYSEIGKEVGLAASTVSRRVKSMIEKYHFNPSLQKHSGKKPAKKYAKYCQNIICHQLFYVTASEIKRKKDFYCSLYCKDAQSLPSNSVFKKDYARMNIEELSDYYKLSIGTIVKLMESYNVTPTRFPETVLVKLAHIAQNETKRTQPRKVFGSRIRSGYRKHLGFTVRSSWENNFALYLKHKKIPFEYEPKKYTFPEERGARAYVPDFHLVVNGKEVIVECKGRLISSDKTKMKRLKKHHPDVFKKMKYMSGKRGDPADEFYKSIGLEPFCYYNELKSEYGHKLKNWEH